ncbi:hypothetical protein Gotur_018925 [Gossypium turneri]
MRIRLKFKENNTLGRTPL